MVAAGRAEPSASSENEESDILYRLWIGYIIFDIIQRGSYDIVTSRLVRDVLVFAMACHRHVLCKAYYTTKGS